MPMGILGVVTMPFGFDAVFWRLMGDGIDWMIRVALWVSTLPGSLCRGLRSCCGGRQRATGAIGVLCRYSY